MNRQQTRGVILLLVIIVALQFAFRNCEFRHTFTPVETTLGYREMDSLRAIATALKKDTIYPFNPNFITDYRGFKLGLTPEQNLTDDFIGELVFTIQRDCNCSE